MENDLQSLQNSIFDLNWLKENIAKIRSEYEGEVIAIRNKNVVAFAPSTDILLKKLNNIGVQSENVLIHSIAPDNQSIIL